jgi:hypothetical protein
VTGCPRGLVSANDFTNVRAALVKELKGDASAAIVFTRISWRCEGPSADDEGWWRGSFDVLAEETGLSPKQVRDAVSKLRDMGWLIAEQRRVDGNNWDRTFSYQTVLTDMPENMQDPSGAFPPAPPRSDPSTPETTELRSVKRETRARAKDPRGTRIPDDWIPSPDLIEWARSEAMGDEFQRVETQRFRNYWLATPGQRGRKLDWDATWRNWLIKEAQDNPGRARANSPNGHGKATEKALGWKNVQPPGAEPGQTRLEITQ